MKIPVVVSRTDGGSDRPCDAVVGSMEFVGGSRFHLDGRCNVEKERKGFGELCRKGV